ncbi:flagellar FlbD family protein [Marinilactibacillus psychrotolerans]|uniref:Endoflagellar protein n=1 Tax=Marinilactibacillus psychrotolerans TaxID=191770 RepID=A0A5R9C7S6_9LACT|nr:flagellar FlbD family protein [Marinilactibacillus psychrotolerans]TLQ09351.1 endoflagellar protein [Marinilactibacillus psychrotolerans]
MILLKSLTGKEFYLNSDLIYRVEKEYDTLITLIDQKTIWVQESPEEIRDKVIQFKNQVYRQPWEVKE